jgi:hypothetical protein
VKLPSAAQLALGGAALVAGGAIAGSASSLYAIATRAQMSAPWSLPVSLDVLALVAAIAVRARRRDGLAWFALATATALSTALQVVDAPADLLARISHGAPPIAALVAFELALRASGTEPATTPAPALTGALDIDRRPPPAPARAEATGTSNPNGQSPAAPNGMSRTSRTTSHTGPPATRTTSRSVEELLPEARLIAERIESAGLSLSRGRLVAAFRDAGTPIGSTKADKLLARLRTPEPVRGEPADRRNGEATPSTSGSDPVERGPRRDDFPTARVGAGERG